MLALALVAGASTACTDEDPAASTDPTSAAVTTFSGLAAPSGDALLLGLDTAAPTPGAVVQVPGPFDDRFTLDELAVHDGVVTGDLTVTSDVSELLELEVQVAFYDDDGRFLGSASSVRHHDESQGHEEAGPPPEESEPFRVVAPRRFADRVSAAAVGVPVLVNE